MTLRIIIVTLVFALAAVLGGAIALLTSPRSRALSDSAQAFNTATATIAASAAAATQTPAPSAEPTGEASPTARATASATATPTAAPTAEPTAEATVAPTSEPTVEPTVEPATDTTPAPGTIIEYTVQPGDILGAIAERFNTTISAIVELNPGINPDSLTVGDLLRVPVGEP